MGLEAGTKLGPYKILTPVGAGGMGEVYRARDTRLDRDVAIKVLPAHLAKDVQFKQRFEREARTVSSLNHPHICTLYDIGREGETDFLVMEFLEGETVAERLKRGKFALAELLKIGMEMADALDKAHRQGVVHRDLKPGNIMLTKSGAKLMDFGLAKPAGLSGGAGSGTAPLLSAAMTSSGASPLSPITSAGSIIGTIQYMSPEQIEGKEADARSDIFALGATLYEMATGARAFPGKSQISVASSILEKDPEPISKAQPLAPPGLDRVVMTCLAKDPDARFQSAHDVKLEIQWAAEAESPAATPAPVVEGRTNRERGAWAAAGVFLLLAALLAVGYVLRAPIPAAMVRASIDLPPKSHPPTDQPGLGGWFAISPNGRRFAFVASNPEGKNVLWVRPLDSLAAQPLAGTEDAAYPFWSPDSARLAFFAEGKLKKIDASGGPVETICAAPLGRGGAWSPTGEIVFAPSVYTGLWRVAAAGGTAVQVTVPDTASTTQRFPSFLPDGRHFLFNSDVAAGGKGGIYAASLDSKEVKLVTTEKSNAQYAAPGYLIFMREGNLMAQPFDASRLATAGDAVPVGENIVSDSIRQIGSFSVSENGVLVFRTTGSAGTKQQLTWIDRDGKELEKVGEPADLSFPILSPDGSQAVVTLRSANGKTNLWIYDMKRGLGSRFTFSAATDENPAWSPDGSQIAFSSDRGGSFDLYLKSARGAGAEQDILSGPGERYLADWSRDGRFITYSLQGGPAKNYQIWILPMTGDRKAYAFLKGEASYLNGAFSPDVRWLAYISDESGHQEAYVVPFPGPGGKWQISSGGALGVGWTKDGRELLYVTPELKLYTVEVNAKGADLALGALHPLLGGRTAQNILGTDFSPDGKRLLAAMRQDNASAPITLVTNWTSGLK